MKRSEINQIMQNADSFIRSQGFHLPSFAYWNPDDWSTKGPEISEIVDNQLGWDITDFGGGDFSHSGLLLFTIRNGNNRNWLAREGKLYAEKIMVVEDGQVTPMHFHWNKMEDIINRGGGKLQIQLYQADEDEHLNLFGDVTFSTDGVKRKVAAGGVVVLSPGESITLVQRCYHKFWGAGRVLVGEVSMVNDDRQDNRFLDSVGRFPEIEEDEAPWHLLCIDYRRYYRY